MTHLDQVPGQNARDQESSSMESQCRDLELAPSRPEVGEESWAAPASTVGNNAGKGRLEVLGRGNLVGSPGGHHDVREKGSQDVRDGLVEQGNEGHSENPELEADEGDVFTLGVAKPGRGHMSGSSVRG